ncbi:MAG: hypothetical protein NVS3B7_01250 [Candidatus Elarobacter sp.]
MDVLTSVLRAGYPFELAGLVYFLFYLTMSRGRNRDRFSRRSKTFTLIASIALVASVPFHYGGEPLAIVVMFAIVGVAMWSTFADRRRPPAA